MALVASILLHALFFFTLNQWLEWFEPDWTSQSQGHAELVLIAPDPSKQAPQTGEEKERPQQKDSVSLAKPTPETKPTTNNATQQKTQESSTLPSPASEAQTATVKQVTASQGDNAPIDTQTTTQQTYSPYEQAVFNHLLSKIDSTPVGGRATLQLTIMPAGIAFDIKILAADTAQYGDWVRKMALSANPYPAFKNTANNGNRVVVISVNHQTID